MTVPQWRINRDTNDFWKNSSETSHSFYAGSHGRGTACKGCSDVDVVFVLPHHIYSRYHSYSGNGQSALLQSIKDSVNTPYWSTSMKGDGQVVVVKFSDYTKFELVPAFLQKDGRYLYPDSNSGGQWKYMNPKAENKAFLELDKETLNGNLKKLCRMMRAWRSKWNVPIQGVLIDTLAYKFIEKWRHRKGIYSCYDQMVYDFFKYLAKQKSTQRYWLMPGSKKQIYRTGSFERRAKKCLQLTATAIKQEKELKHYSANKIWREVFGYRFPA